MNPTALRNRLEGLRGRLRGLYVLYGVLRLAAALAAAVLLLYVLDRTLSLPVEVRLLFLALLCGGAVFLLWRGVVYPLRRRVRVEDVACAVEERFPELDGRLISTLELEGAALDPDRNVSAELVEILRRETGAVADGIRFERIFNYKRLRRLGAVAAVLVAVVIGHAMLEPALSGIFLDRLLGGDARWPQKVILVVELPAAAEHFSVESEDGHPARVRIARGASLPVTVRAVGEAPAFVELKTDSESGRTAAVPLAPTAGSEWVGRFRAVKEPFVFWPHDGDANDDGRPVQVEVFTPPGVSEVVTVLDFPDYTGLETRREERGDVEAPVGTRVTLEVRISGAAASGRVVFDPAGGLLDLVPLADTTGAWTATFPVQESCSYAIHLVGENGFANLDPVSHAVIAVKDRPPVVRLLEPARTQIEVTPEAVVPFRVAADDDYGVAALSLTMRPFSGQESRTFDLLAEAVAGADSKRRVVYHLLDLPKNAFTHTDGVRGPQIGDSYVYTLEAEDNHAAGDAVLPHVTTVEERRVDVVSVNEKLRLLTERQIRLKDDVRALRDLQDEKNKRLKEALTDYEASEGDRPPEVDDLAALEIGQNQVTNRATRLAREFTDLYEEYLLNRIDRSAAAERLIPLLVERKRRSDVLEGLDFALYRPLIEAWQGGSFGQLDVLGRLLDMVACILDVSEVLSPQAGAAISDARLRVDASERPDGIRAALLQQEAALKRLDELLEKMDEWEDFQEILTLFRDLLEDQRDLNARTRNSLKSGN